MINLRQLFLQNVAQTSENPMLVELESAKGVFLFDPSGQRYFDFTSGIAVNSLGHGNLKIINAVQQQAAQFMHTMVYGEHVQPPQVRYAQKLLTTLGSPYESVYFLTTGTESVELGIKLAKRYTGRSQIVACRRAYHGSTVGAESLRSDLDYTAAFMPLMPGVKHVDFNDFAGLSEITRFTAAVICEPVQAEAGIIPPLNGYLEALASKCREVGALFVLDEIQTGFGRTGRLFAHQRYGVQPDILLLGKAMGGGMPLAGVASSRDIMHSLVSNPMLGHITTFGGHPVSCAAAEAALDILLSTSIIDQVQEKEDLIKQRLQHPLIKEIRSAGLMMAVELETPSILGAVLTKAREFGVLMDYFLFNDRSFRIAPPLVITIEELNEACDRVLEGLDSV